MEIKPNRSLASIETLVDKRKCKIHRSWKKKGVCDLCRLAEEKALQQYKLTHDIEHKEVVIKKI